MGIDGTDPQAERIARPDDDRVRPPLPRHAHDRPYRLQQHPLPIRMRVVRIFRESVCVFAPSPASEETTGQICAHIEEALAQVSERDYLSCSVSASEDQGGLTTYTATLAFTPTIFGAYPLRRVFDVELSPIEHPITMSVDSYKPGVFV